MDIKQRDEELNRMILKGRALEAFDKFYAEDVVMQEDDEEPFVGKDVNRQREEEFFGNVTELREAELNHAAVGDGVSMSTWSYDYTHAEWGDQQYDQVAVREWNDEGKVQKERFFKAA